MILAGKIRQLSFLIIRKLNMLNIVDARLTGLQMLCSFTLVFSMLLASGAAMADRPEWAGSRNGDDEQNQQHKHKKRDSYREDNDGHENRYEGRHESDRYEGRRGGVVIQIGGYFDDRRRADLHEYYHERERSGHCPPGLAKKHNGCVPPGHDRRWSRGEYLPRDVVYHSVEPEILIRLGTPPAGHKFVRVAADILLIAVGTGLVVDAIDDLGR
jgi:Ni/Co efflux regulator RcnB